jgi:uncharacterized surface protein with fasciclin (FAS1) repeats
MQCRSAAPETPHFHSLSAPGIPFPSTTDIAASSASDPQPSLHRAAVRIASSRIKIMDTKHTPQTATKAQVVAPVATQSSNLLDTAAAKGSFGTFAKAVEQAGLGETLRGTGPFTVFAPTDAAFAQLPPGKLDTLMKPENKEELSSILKYHVLTGRKSVADISKWDSARTMHGQPAPIKMTEGKFSIDGANVTDSDIGSSNGLMHGIDKVNLPAVAAV